MSWATEAQVEYAKRPLEERNPGTWWLVERYDVTQVTGYECGPDVPAHARWVPEVRMTAFVGVHLFASREQAVQKLRGDLLGEKDRIENALARNQWGTS